MPTVNVKKVIENTTASTVGTAYTDAVDMSGFSKGTVYIYVPNGSATAGHNIAFTVQGCDEDASAVAEWADITPRINGTYAVFTVIDGTGGTTPWPKAQVGFTDDFPKYIRLKIVITTGGTWSYRTTIEAKQVN